MLAIFLLATLILKRTIRRICAGLEPHSVLPVAVPAIMNTHAGVLPPSCRNCHSLATSAAFWVPFGRHVWWWLSIRPATRKTFQNLLSRGKTVCVTPGGVQECLYMEPGHEVAFLKKRLGFIRIAIKQGCAFRSRLRQLAQVSPDRK